MHQSPRRRKGTGDGQGRGGRFGRGGRGVGEEKRGCRMENRSVPQNVRSRFFSEWQGGGEPAFLTSMLKKENTSSKLVAAVNPAQCTLCGRCVRACPQQAISINDNHCLVINRKMCAGCGICIDECAKNALQLREIQI